MTTFAHTETGLAQDCSPAADVPTYLRNLGLATVPQGWIITQVPDGTIQDATLVNGVWTNPVAPVSLPPAPMPDPVLTAIAALADQFTTLQAQITAINAGVAALSTAAAAAITAAATLGAQSPPPAN